MAPRAGARWCSAAGVPCKFNLIPFNPFPQSGLQRSPRERVLAFAAVLQRRRHRDHGAQDARRRHRRRLRPAGRRGAGPHRRAPARMTRAPIVLHRGAAAPRRRSRGRNGHERRSRHALRAARSGRAGRGAAARLRRPRRPPAPAPASDRATASPRPTRATPRKRARVRLELASGLLRPRPDRRPRWTRSSWRSRPTRTSARPTTCAA